MANNATAKSLIEAVEAKTDHTFTDLTNKTKSEVLAWINEGLATLWDELINKHEDYAVSRDAITLVAGTETYALPADYYKTLGVFLYESAKYKEIARFMFRELAQLSDPYVQRNNASMMYRVLGAEIRFDPAPTAAGTVHHFYAPCLTKLALGQATKNIGAGANGTVAITHAGGVEGNNWTVQVVAGSGLNVALSAAIVTRALTITLGTDGAGALDATKNTASLVAGIVNALNNKNISATASGTGASALTGAEGPYALAGGTDGGSSVIDPIINTGWEVYAIDYACKNVAIAMEEDPAPFVSGMMVSLAQVIKFAANRDSNFANRIIDQREIDLYNANDETRLW